MDISASRQIHFQAMFLTYHPQAVIETHEYADSLILL